MIKNLRIECLCLSIPCNDFRNKPDFREEDVAVDLLCLETEINVSLYMYLKPLRPGLGGGII